MADAKAYEDMLTSGAAGRQLVTAFSNALAKAEAELGVKPRNVLINGIILDDVISASYDLTPEDSQKLVEYFLKIDELDPNILINGISVNNLRTVKVAVGNLRI